MWNIIKGEWQKLRRCQILLVGIVALALCPVVQYGSQLIVNPEIRDPNYDFVRLFSSVVWGNTQVFLPISLVMIGGWMIDREHHRLLGGKLAVAAALALVFGVYSVIATVVTGSLAGLDGFSMIVLARQGGQVILAAFYTGLVCMPLILIFGQIRGAYLAGSLLTFFLGYCILFFKGGFLLSAYPFSAALVLSGFDMQEYNGAIGMLSVLLLTAGVLFSSHPGSRAGSSGKKKKKKGRGQRRRR